VSEQTTPYVIGIDLGTTNSALSFMRVAGVDGQSAQSTDLTQLMALHVLQVAQQTAPDQVSKRQTLPSFYYIPHSAEARPPLPWDIGASGASDKSAIVGDYARHRAAEAPDRVVVSAKSWLCASHVGRQDAILPWRSEITAGKVSPLDASVAYLKHLGAAFTHDRRMVGESVDLASGTVVLTVPASFDDTARALTHKAAAQAGFGEPILLEEPLAALYAWLGAHEKTWREYIAPGDMILVCDVGGGTCDFSLIAVDESGGDLELSRISVGDHLLLGGDNMDLALAHLVKTKFKNDGHELDHWQFLSLVAAARTAKERLLADELLAVVPIAVAGRGSSLFATSLTTELSRSEVESLIVEGFLPQVDLASMPPKRRGSGIQTAGLPYESDPAITRHMARFLQKAAQNVAANPQLTKFADKIRGDFLAPRLVLFNGGVFKSQALRQRLVDVLQSWCDLTVRELDASDLELAVALGATYYGRLRATGKGIRVQSGTARSYYLGLEDAAPAVPGLAPEIRGLCIVAQGTDEGSQVAIGDQQFGLVVGEPVDFRLYSSTVRSGDRPGGIIADAARQLDEGGLLSLELPASAGEAGKIVPVNVDSHITETGLLQIYMKDVASDRKWHLEFNLRAHEY